MADLDFALFDADNHYYEATDAFSRFIPDELARRGMQWAEIGGRTRLMVGGRVNRFIPNPQFDPVAKPGCLDAYFRGKSAASDMRAAFGELDPISPAYREPGPRVALMDQQNTEGCFMFPTLGVGMEEALLADPEAANGVFHAFNRWVLDDWGFDHDGRIFSAPYLCLIDPDAVRDEVAWALDEGARVFVMRAGPVLAPGGGRSPADPVYDPMWSLLDQAGVTVAYHSGEAGYGRYAADWGENPEFEAFRRSPFISLTQGHRPIYDTIAALLSHGLFQRFDNLRVATIESGSDWVPTLVTALHKTYKQNPDQWAEDPVETLRRHVSVSPYYEDDIRELADLIGADRVLMGSDYPHAEGLAEPSDYVHDLHGFSADEIRLIMRENGLSLATPQPR